VLGFLWILLNPLLQMVVIGSVFSFILKVPVVENFLLLFTGLLMWNFFSLTFLKVTPSIVYELNLIEKAKFPREVIVLSIILSNLFHTVISFALFVIVLAVLGRVEVFRLLLLPLPLLWMSAILVGGGFLTSALNVKYRDINFFVQALVPLLFYASPILFTVGAVPQRFQFLLYLNPIVGAVEMVRWILIQDAFPSWQLLLSNLGLTIGILMIGIFIFRREAPFFDDWV
jgi:lipopolysaccharide transport system permease protein